MKLEKKHTRFGVSRRSFLRTTAAGSLGLLLPWQCKQPAGASVLSAAEASAAEAIFSFLLPSDGNGPASRDIHAVSYLDWLLADPLYDADIQAQIRSGLTRCLELAQKRHGKAFRQLTGVRQRDVLEHLKAQRHGEDFFSRMLSVLIDALVIDPVYGTQVQQQGWKWLGHIPGKPRPGPANRYPEILKRKRLNQVITSIQDLDK